jgi:MFS family permease
VRTVRQWVGETTGGLPRSFWFLWTNTLINRIGSFVVILLAIYLTEVRHLTPAFAGLVIGFWGAGGAVGTLLGGVLADRWGRKKTFLTFIYGAAGAMLLLGMARGRLEIAAAVLLLGLLSEGSRPPVQALMIDIVPDRDRLRAFSLTYWVINLGFSFAAATAGFVAGIDFTLLFILDAATTVAGATVVAFTVREPIRVPAPAARPGPGTGRGRGRVKPLRGPGLRAVFADRVFISFVGVNVLTALVFMQHISTLPIAMAQDGLSPSTFGSVIALNGVLIVIGQLFVPRLLGRFGRSTALAIAAVVLGLGFGLNAFAHTPVVYAVAVLIWTVGEMLNAPSNSSVNAELSPVDLRGRYQGVFTLSWSAASFIAPIAGGAVLQYAGGVTLWLGCFVIACVVAVLHLLAGPSRVRRAAEIRAAEIRAAEIRATEIHAGDLRPGGLHAGGLHGGGFRPAAPVLAADLPIATADAAEPTTIAVPAP